MSFSVAFAAVCCIFPDSKLNSKDMASIIFYESYCGKVLTPFNGVPLKGFICFL